MGKAEPDIYVSAGWGCKYKREKGYAYVMSIMNFITEPYM